MASVNQLDPSGRVTIKCVFQDIKMFNELSASPIQVRMNLILLACLVGVVASTTPSVPRLQYGTIFRMHSYLSTAGNNVFHLTVGVEIPRLPDTLQYKIGPCINSTGPLQTFCQRVSSLLDQHVYERRHTVARILHINNQTRSLLPPGTTNRRQRALAGALRWLLGAASESAVRNLNSNMKMIHSNMEHLVDVQNAQARSLTGFMRASNKRLNTAVAGITNNSLAITEIQNRIQDILGLVTSNETGFYVTYNLATLTPDLVALVRKDINLLQDIQCKQQNLKQVYMI